jgi:hypothetical protein
MWERPSLVRRSLGEGDSAAKFMAASGVHQLLDCGPDASGPLSDRYAKAPELAHALQEATRPFDFAPAIAARLSTRPPACSERSAAKSNGSNVQ